MVVHGSQALGLWDEESDLDLLTQRPLVQLMKAEGEAEGSCFFLGGLEE